MTEKAGNESMNHYQKLTACSAQTVSFVASFACSVSLGKKKEKILWFRVSCWTQEILNLHAIHIYV